MNKTILTITLCALLVCSTVPGAQAFTLFGFDVGGFFSNIFGGEKTQEIVEEPTTTTVPHIPISFDIAGTTYQETIVKAGINADANLKGYIRGFGYECLGLKTDAGLELTSYFNIESGELIQMNTGIKCDTVIEIEEALITQIQQEGFDGSKAMEYAKQAKIPSKVYLKALKVFTVG